MSMKAVKIIDAICIVIFVLMGVYIFVLPNATQDLLLPVFTIINPYKTGAWIMGIGFLVTCLWGKGRAGLLWYLHPIPIVIGCIVAICRKTRGQSS